MIFCPPPERQMPDGTRPGPCHVYGRCPDLNRCVPAQRCQVSDDERYPAISTGVPGTTDQDQTEED